MELKLFHVPMIFYMLLVGCTVLVFLAWTCETLMVSPPLCSPDPIPSSAAVPLTRPAGTGGCLTGCWTAVDPTTRVPVTRPPSVSSATLCRWAERKSSRPRFQSHALSQSGTTVRSATTDRLLFLFSPGAANQQRSPSAAQTHALCLSSWREDGRGLW